MPHELSAWRPHGVESLATGRSTTPIMTVWRVTLAA